MSGSVDLSNKRIVVTGAGHGLGRSYAIALGRAGAAVVVNSRNADLGSEVADQVRKACRPGGGQAPCLCLTQRPRQRSFRSASKDSAASTR